MSPMAASLFTFHRHPTAEVAQMRVASPISTPRDPSPRDPSPRDDASQAGASCPVPAPQRRRRRVVCTAVVATEAVSTEAVEGVVIQDPHDEALKQLEERWQRCFIVVPSVFIDKKLADGAWSAIYCVNGAALGQKFALKATPMIGALAEATAAQITTMKALQHPNIITFHDTFIHKVGRTNFLCIKMDYCKKGSLQEFVDKKQKEKGAEVPASRICDFLLQISSALTYIHEKGVLHGDLRLENVLRTSSDQLKLTEFATTSVVPHRAEPLSITGGQQMYAPPEWVASAFSRRPLQPHEIPEVSYDMWGFGCIVSELVTLRLISGDRVPPTEALASNEAALDEVLHDLGTAHQGAFSAIGRQLLHVDPDERMTAVEAAAAVEALMAHLPTSTSFHRRQFTSLLSVLSTRS